MGVEDKKIIVVRTSTKIKKSRWSKRIWTEHQVVDTFK